METSCSTACRNGLQAIAQIFIAFETDLEVLLLTREVDLTSLAELAAPVALTDSSELFRVP